MFDSVVVGADDSETAAESVNQAVALAKLSGGTLHIVTAYKPKPVTDVDLPDEFRYTVPSMIEADVLLRKLGGVAADQGVR